MIYQRVYIDGTEITLAVDGWVTPEPVYLAGSAPGVVETSEMTIVLPLLLREYGLSYETVRDCTGVFVEWNYPPGKVTRQYRIIGSSLEAGQVTDDTARFELSSLRSGILDGLLPLAYREALEDCYIPLHWPPGVTGSLDAKHGLMGRYLSTSGAALREWPGELVVGLESRAQRMNWGIAPLGDTVAVGDYDGLYNGKSSLDIVGLNLRLGAKLADLGDLQVLFVSIINGTFYAYAAPGFARYEFPTDYADVTSGGIYRLSGAVGGGLSRLGKWGFGREWYATRTYKSRSVFIGRDAINDARDGDRRFYYRIQHGQVIGSVLPAADRSEYEGYIAQQTDDVAPDEMWLIEGSEEWRERRWIAASALDMIIYTDEISQSIDKGWHLDVNYPITPTIEGWSGNIFIPVRSRISIAYEDEPGSIPVGDYSSGDCTPDVHVWKRWGRNHWTDYPAGDNGGPGPYDPAAYDLGTVPLVVEPGWYAVGALGPECKQYYGRNPYNPDYMTIGRRQNRVRQFVITIEPIEPINMIGHTLAADTEVVAIGQTVSAPLGDLTGQTENSWNYSRQYVERRTAGGALSSATSLPVGAVGARLAYDDTDIWCAYCYPARLDSLWTFAQGQQPEGSALILKRFSDPSKHFLVATTIPRTANSYQSHNLSDEMYDYSVGGIKWQSGDLYLSVKKRRRLIERLNLPIRKAGYCWNEPPYPNYYDTDDDAVTDTARANMGYLKIGGDATEQLKSGDTIRLYIPRWTRSGDAGGDGALTQRLIAYPIEQRIVNVSYVGGEQTTTVIIDPGPDRSHVELDGEIGQTEYGTGYWLTGSAEHVQDDSAPVDAEVWLDRGWGPWAAELWKIPAGSFGAFDLRSSVEVIDAATQEYQHTIRPRYEAGTWIAELQAEPIGDVEVRGYRAVVIDMESRPGISFLRDPGEVEVRYTGTSEAPYAFAGNYIIQNGDVYNFSGDSLVLAYSGPSVDMTPVGDSAEGGDGYIYVPVAADNGARMLVIGNNLPPGMGLKPPGNSIRTLRNWLKIAAAFGCKQGPGGWAMTTLLANARGIETDDVLEWWYDADYSATKQLPVKYGKSDYYPSPGALTLGGEPEHVDMSSVICSAPDAAHIYAWRAMIGEPVLGRFYVKHRITPSNIKMLDYAGELHTYDFERPMMGVMLGMTVDLERAIMTVEYADIGELHATGV